MTIIYTKRFTLRPITEADAPAFAKICNDELIARNTARIPHPYTLDNAIAFTRYAMNAVSEKKEFPFAVCDGETIIGCSGVLQEGDAWELGYWIANDARGRGAATEAARATVQFAIQGLCAKSVISGHFTDNIVSGRVLEKIGFRYTGKSVTMHSLGRGREVETRRMELSLTDFEPPPAFKVTP
ncbi:GNAT family N-acetyltransferase [Hyphococcus flavus]|uniref:GNAT family N-acetyltransferase n=1 Tax=Hyphococcus flavus TaxID=1866326 RepID=A0AAE9ZAD7_9PROT|nr:GNAT family N-acetyltransferase [Hyphococcus flavus]WDI30016.1 GNAT family N-acetyltransferase [Hyphococcus flavus]